MDYYSISDAPLPALLLQGCFHEALRADEVSKRLETLRTFLPDSLQSYITAVSEEIKTSSRLLRDMADLSQAHIPRVPVILSYLHVLLPCLCRSLRDITNYYDDKALTKELRWRTMYHKMTDEAGGLPLPQRFTMYNHFLTLLAQLLTR